MVNFPSNQIIQKSKLNLQVKTGEGIEIIPLTKILWIEANTSYSYFHLSDGSKVFSRDTIGYFESKIKPYGFLRIHKSVIVNINSIQKYRKEGDGVLVLIDGSILKLARSKKQKLSEYLDEYFL